MKLIDKYIMKNFLIPFFLALLFVVFMMHITELFDRISFFTSKNISLGQIGLYFLYKTPFILLEMLPVAVLFSTVFSLATMSKNNELISIISTGVSFYRIVRTYVIMGLIIFILAVIWGDKVMPVSNVRAQKLNQKFRNFTENQINRNIQKYDRDNSLYFIDNFNYKTATMKKITIIKKNVKNDIEYRLDAKTGEWNFNKKKWVFHNGIIRYFSTNSSVLSTEKFETKELNLKMTPLDFKKENKNIDDMSIREAWKYIQRLKNSGFGYGEELVQFHWKFAFPFSVVIMILIGAPLSGYSKKNILISSFFYSFIFTFIYYLLLNMSLSFGKNEVLSPLVAAWLGNVVFSVFIVILFKSIRT